MKQKWEPMQLQYVGRVGQVMRGMNGTNMDPGHDANTKRGGG